ncbi:MAG: hypothetical protein JXA94_03470 [Parachlamydiales bacterium]|nr:hypothetical protein [Parachlamydiales bacterium]
MDINNFKKLLEESSNIAVRLRVKEYKSTYISVAKSKKEIKISLHSLFLNSPESIKKALFSFCLKRDKASFNIIKGYANRYFENLDYTHKLDKKKLFTKGKVYDLKNILDTMNLFYFKDKLNLLNITWFEVPNYTKFRHFTFGSYDKNLKLIRINKLLDSDIIPFYFINYVVYHEILHYIIPEKMGENLRRSVHSKEFKEKEKRFAYYKEARSFEKKFLKLSKRKIVYGRS